MSTVDLNQIVAGMKDGSVVPYLGAYALNAVRDEESGAPMPADSESLILAINGGKPMSPKLMYEFPRAAMNLELKKGRRFIEKALSGIYAGRKWTASPLHEWLARLDLPYIIDTNRDDLLQRAYLGRPHLLVVGIARLGGTDYRFKLFQSDGESYEQRSLEEADSSLPVLFKPLGTPVPESTFIASDADFVDYLTELMGGFAVPAFVKKHRIEKRYVLLGLPLTRDTERMIVSDLIYGSPEQAGWAFLPAPTEKEERFCERQGFTIVRASPEALMTLDAQAAE